MKALALLLALAGGQQTFWTLSTGPAPSPYPSPTTYPVNWYGVLYYPVFWPVCKPALTSRCRPRNAHVWPPQIPSGKHAVPAPP